MTYGTQAWVGAWLSALITEVPAAAEPEPARLVAESAGESALQVSVEQIRDNPYQPRRRFDKERLDELVSSIKIHGVIEPLILRRVEGHLELVSGERRLRAARQAGLATVPAVIRGDVSDRQSLEYALIENLQREDLNAIEEAAGYHRLAEQFGLSQEEVAQRVGKARATVTNALRLLALPEDIKQMVSDGILTRGTPRRCSRSKSTRRSGWWRAALSMSAGRSGKSRKPWHGWRARRVSRVRCAAMCRRST